MLILEMKMSIINKMKSNLNPEECFKAWVETDTVHKACEFMANRGIVNPRTGKPYTSYSIWRSAMIWVIENPEKAKPYYIDAGANFTDHEWNEFLVQKACHVYGATKSRITRWIKKMGLEDYDYIYTERTGVSKIS